MTPPAALCHLPRRHQERLRKQTGKALEAALRAARELLLTELAKDTPGLYVGDHYQFIPHYQALRLMVAHGLLSAEELRRLDEKLVDNALAHPDSYAVYYRTGRKRLMARKHGNPDRHNSSTIVGTYLLLEYLINFADLEAGVREQLVADHALFVKIIRDWSENRVFRANTDDSEALDCTAFFIYAYMHLGIEAFVCNGVLENMANFYLNNVNNLWCNAGASSYIGACRGYHISSPDGGLAARALAFFTQDRGLEFLDTQRFEAAGNYQRGFCDRARMCLDQPEPFALPAAEAGAGAAVLPCPMLRTTPLDPCMWAGTAAAADTAGSPLPLTYDQAYDTIGFRDGWSERDAFLGLKGVHGELGGRVWQINTIVGYTEHGARLLFGGSMTYEQWSRSSITVDTSGYSEQDRFARRDACVSSGDVALVASTCARLNGTRWQRTVLRRRGAYFAVLDDLTALRDDMFRITATWRVLPPGQVDERGAFRAVAENGVAFAIVPGELYACDVTRPAVDGVARPTFYRQQRDVRLDAGQTVAFHNVIRATPAGADAAVPACTVGPGNLLYVQEPGDNNRTALIGTRVLPEAPGLPAGACAAFYLTADLWLLGGVQALQHDGHELLRSSQLVDVVLDWAQHQATVIVHGPAEVDVLWPAAFGGTGAARPLPPGAHAFDLTAAQTKFRAAATALIASPAAPATAAAATSRPAAVGMTQIWRKHVQTQPASIVRPLRVQASQPPDQMALHNLCDGVLWSSSVPAPAWRVPELVLTLEPPPGTHSVAGLRLFGSAGRGDIE